MTDKKKDNKPETVMHDDKTLLLQDCSLPL